MSLILKHIFTVLLAPLMLINAGCGSSADTLPAENTQVTEPVKLDWQEMQPTLKPEAWAGLPSDAEIISDQHLEAFGGIRLTFFTKPGDEDYVYAGLESSAGSYFLGPSGTYNYREPGDSTAAACVLFDGVALKITGGLGANLSLSSYYNIDALGIPAGVLQVSTGHTREVDVDRDGSTEVVAAHGTPMSAYVYRWHNGHAEEAYLNDALQADSVMLRDDLVYETADLGESQVMEYRLIPEELIPVDAE
ncbi:hypothetical protein [Paenibacillus sp. FSL H3-0469]|uniref:hypothetical protein n=1 Tax=Paenibacillus sp. FSL H3-0469 TaxID=2954506 RepID=UPI003101263D